MSEENKYTFENEEYRDTVDGWAEQGCRVLLAARYDGDPVPGGLPRPSPHYRSSATSS